MNIASFFGVEAFGPDDIKAISIALDEVCSKLGLTDDKQQEEREVLAKRIIVLARHGLRNPAALRDSSGEVLTIPALAACMTPPKRRPASNSRGFITSNPDRVRGGQSARLPAREAFDFGYNTLPR